MKMFLEERLSQIYYLFDSPASLETSFRSVSKLGKQDRIAGLRLNGGYGSSGSGYGGSSSGYSGSSGGYSSASGYASSSSYDKLTSGLDNDNSFNWNDSFDSDARDFGKGVDPDKESAGNGKRISRMESETLNRDLKQLVSEGWSVIVTHEGRGYDPNSVGDITVYKLCTPDGKRITDTFYDMNNDGIIDYAK